MAQGQRGGRVKGSKNKLTRSAREAFMIAFNRMGGANGLTKWGQDNPTEFYKLYARLIPVHVTAELVTLEAVIAESWDRPLKALPKHLLDDDSIIDAEVLDEGDKEHSEQVAHDARV